MNLKLSKIKSLIKMVRGICVRTVSDIENEKTTLLIITVAIGDILCS